MLIYCRLLNRPHLCVSILSKIVIDEMQNKMTDNENNLLEISILSVFLSASFKPSTKRPHLSIFPVVPE